MYRTTPSSASRSTRIPTMLIVLMLSSLHFAAKADGAFLSYHVGNSLTWDSQVRSFENRPLHDNQGYHIKCSSSLTSILNNPESVCVDPTTYGYFTEALSSHDWDAVTLQPYVGYGTGTEIESFVTMASMTNSTAEILMYATWPWANDVEEGFVQEWYAGPDAQYEIDSPMIHRRSWYEHALTKHV